MTGASVARGSGFNEGLQGRGAEEGDQLSPAPVGDELAAPNERADAARGEAQATGRFVEVHEVIHRRAPSRAAATTW